MDVLYSTDKKLEMSRLRQVVLVTDHRLPHRYAYKLFIATAGCLLHARSVAFDVFRMEVLVYMPTLVCFVFVSCFVLFCFVSVSAFCFLCYYYFFVCVCFSFPFFVFLFCLCVCVVRGGQLSSTKSYMYINKNTERMACVLYVQPCSIFSLLI